MRTVNLVSRDNGVGLTTDMDLLQAMLTAHGYDVQRVGWQDRTMRRCDVVIFLELFNPRLMRYARKSVGVFNLEWFLPRWRSYLPRISQLWAKSFNAHETFLSMRLRSYLTGFMTRDLLNESVPQGLTCLHLKGHSNLKNTPAVIDAWAANPDLPPLTIISETPIPYPPPGITVLPRVDHATLVQQLNTHQIHVCPSRAEGWGHYITEGMSARAVVVTTDAPPMNEHVRPEWGVLLPPTASTPRQWVSEYGVDPNQLASGVRQIAALTSEQRAAAGNAARAHVLHRNEIFRQTALNLLENLCT